MTTTEIINQTKRLMAIPSTADNPQALKDAVALVEEIVQKVPNVTIEHFEQNGKPSFLAYQGKTRPKTFDILLNGHVDVVPGPAKIFKPRVKDGRLYGRGALDMKGTALTLTDLFCELVNEVPYALGLQIVSDEEIGGYDGVRLHIDRGIRASFVVMGEYANDRHTIYNAARGLCWAEIAFKGKTAHGGHLWNGSNAILKAGSFAAAVLERYPTPDKETWTTTASIANLSTPNDAFNKVPDSAVLKIDFRFTQEDPVFENRESLEAFVASIDPDATIVNLATFEPAVNVATLNPYVQGLNAAMEKTTGKEASFLGRPAGSDGRHFALVQNDIIEFGLYGQNPHSDDEYVELASFEEYRHIMQTFLRKPLLTDTPNVVKIEELATRLAQGKEPVRMWYATYGSGLSKENFARQIRGGPSIAIPHTFKGCTDKTLPLRDEFISLPYDVYFAGKCIPCNGGHIAITSTPSKGAHTIGRAHLITVEQFKEIVADQNGQAETTDLPFQKAMEQGHATIGEGQGYYNELVFCGMKEGFPMFSVTAARPRSPYQPPSPGYTRLLCIGLSENTALQSKSAVEYVAAMPGMEGNFPKKDIVQLFHKPHA